MAIWFEFSDFFLTFWNNKRLHYRCVFPARNLEFCRSNINSFILTQYVWSRLTLSYHLWHVQPRIVSTKSVIGSLYQIYVCSIKNACQITITSVRHCYLASPSLDPDWMDVLVEPRRCSGWIWSQDGTFSQLLMLLDRKPLDMSCREPCRRLLQSLPVLIAYWTP